MNTTAHASVACAYTILEGAWGMTASVKTLPDKLALVPEFFIATPSSPRSYPLRIEAWVLISSTA